MSIPQAIGQNIAQLRKEKGITQERLALESDMSVSYLRAIEHGKANPTISALGRLAFTLEIPFNTIIITEAGDDIDEIKQYGYIFI